MGGTIHTGNLAHDLACQKAESSRQSTVAAATQNPAGQVTVNNAEIAWARACVASCQANNGNAGMEAFQSLLRALGTGGT
jgi:replication-associated recombination protein RarA